MNRLGRVAAAAALLPFAFLTAHCDKSTTPNAATSPKAAVEPTKGDASGTTPTGQTPPTAGKTADAGSAGTTSSAPKADATPSRPMVKADASAAAKTSADAASTPTPAGAGTGPVVSAGMKVPVEESYKATVARAIVAAMTADEEKGWALYQKELHTKEIFPQRLKSIRRFNWPSMRRKVKLYLKDDTKPEFTITRIDKIDDRTVKVFVHNERSLPTPCILQKDDAQKGEYRITNCSL